MDELNINTADKVGQMLLTENYRSVYSRYQPVAGCVNPVHNEEYVFSRVNGKVDPVQVLKAIDCLEYQSCYHPGWKDSDARRFLENLRGRATNQLPGYQEAQWEVR